MNGVYQFMTGIVPQVIEYSNQRILTSQQIADAYGTDVKAISYNYSYNKKRYVLGKHYFALEGKVKQEFISNHREIPASLKNARTIYLWTFEGCVMHFNALRHVPLSTLLEIAEMMGVERVFKEVRVRCTKRVFSYEGEDDNKTRSPEEKFKLDFFIKLIDTTISSVTTRFEKLVEWSSIFDFVYNAETITRLYNENA